MQRAFSKFVGNCLLFLAGFLFAALTSSEALEIGLGTADITPDVTTFRVPLAGYGARLGRPATGIHDPLRAKVLYLNDKNRHMALIAVDLRSSTPEFKKQIVEKTADLGMNLDNIFVAASHTHAGPSMYPEKFWQMQFGKYDPAIVDIMTSAIAQAIRRAAAATIPARVGYAAKNLDGFTRNRRWRYNTEQRNANGETPNVEPKLSVVRFDDMNGECLALAVHFAAHPTILGAENMRISAEWPGVLQRELERAFPKCVALYLNGAEGDQSPAVGEGGDEFERMNNYGMRLAQYAAQLAEQIETRPDLSIGYMRCLPDLPEITFPESARRKFAAYADAAREALPGKAELQLFQIGPIALAGLPGEPIMEVGQAVEEGFADSDFELPLAIGLANDYIGYIVNEKEYAHGGYEVESRSYYGSGLGAFIETEIALMGKKLAGKATCD